MLDEVRRGNIVIKKGAEEEITRLGDTQEFKKFKDEILSRLQKLENDVSLLKTRQVKESVK